MKTITFKGSVNIDIDTESKTVNISEYGTHIFSLSFDEIEGIQDAIIDSEVELKLKDTPDFMGEIKKGIDKIITP